MIKHKFWNYTGFWFVTTLIFVVLFVYAGAFALNQLAWRVNAESRAVQVEMELTRMQINVYALKEKYKTCMDAHKFGGRND